MNIILLQYERNKRWDTDNLDDYYKNSWKFFELMVKQLNRIYVRPNIHVLTNRNLEKRPNVIYHIDPDIEQNNYAKLKVFGLLDEPAMYIDNDILINRPFEQQHMQDVAFNVFTLYHSVDQNQLPEDMRHYPHFNTGVIWIGRPSKTLVEEISSSGDLFRRHPKWVNDEYPISYYIMKNGLSMQIDAAVNQYREDIPTKEDRGRCQTIHYTGKQFKDLLFLEYMQRWKVVL